jgi:hypothetical protein
MANENSIFRRLTGDAPTEQIYYLLFGLQREGSDGALNTTVQQLAEFLLQKLFSK